MRMPAAGHRADRVRPREAAFGDASPKVEQRLTAHPRAHKQKTEMIHRAPL